MCICIYVYVYMGRPHPPCTAPIYEPFTPPPPNPLTTHALGVPVLHCSQKYPPRKKEKEETLCAYSNAVRSSQNVFSYYRMCSLTIKEENLCAYSNAVRSSQNVFS